VVGTWTVKNYVLQCVILVQYFETGLRTGSGATGVGNNSAS
jgi:hypothetical protein